MKIVTWNINGVRARIDNLLHWLQERSPTSSACRRSRRVDEGFPRARDRGAGLQCRDARPEGLQRRRHPVEAAASTRCNRGLPGDDADEQARFIEGVFSTPRAARARRLALSAERQPGRRREKFAYKLAWMERLERWARERLELEEPLVLAGDYNVIPEPIDARVPENWVNDALFQPETRAAFRRLENLGFTDAVRATTDAAASTPSGTTRPAPGRRTTASASTICCCRPRRPTGCAAVDRQACARLGKAVGPRAGGGGADAGGGLRGTAVLKSVHFSCT